MTAYTVTYTNQNYGSILQAYALQCKLREYGVDPIILQNETAKPVRGRMQRWIGTVMRVLEPRKNYSLTNRFKLECQKNDFDQKREKLNRFKKEKLTIRLVQDAVSFAETLKGDDILIAGSDQIWNMLQGPLSKWYTLQWARNTTVRKYSYAASFGMNTLSSDQVDACEKALRDFQVLSIREEQLAKKLKPHFSIPVRNDLDPTLLYDAVFWDQLAAERIIWEPYIFVYMLRPDRKVIQMARLAAEKRHCKVIYTGLLSDHFHGVETVCSAGVEDFLSYIKYAEAIITNSFHGTAFSILYRKNFISVQIASTSSRVENLLKKLELTERYVTDGRGIEVLDKSIQFDHPIQILEIERKDSEAYLKSICCGVAAKDNIRDKMRSIVYLDTGNQQDCRGCTACQTVCPVNAIDMIAMDGFLYPQIDKSRCINCGRCRTVCSNAVSKRKDSQLDTWYYGWNKNVETRRESTSGGAFPAIVDAWLNVHPESWVYGAVYDEQFIVRHVGTKDRNEIQKMFRSKYVQSDLRGVYPRILAQLRNEEYVLFSGTPCQVAALLALTGEQSSFLLTVDFICHGVSNPELFAGYLSDLSHTRHGRVLTYSFRNKRLAPFRKSHRLVRIAYEDGHISLTDKDPFLISYKNRLFYRASCDMCCFASEQRLSDFTLGDFWNLENEIVSLKKERVKGLSMVVTHTQKAQQMIKTMQNTMDLKQYCGDRRRYRYLFTPTECRKGKPKPLIGEHAISAKEQLRICITPSSVFAYRYPRLTKRIHRIQRSFRMACRIILQR